MDPAAPRQPPSGRVESIGPEVDTAIPGSDIARKLYIPAYGPPQRILPFFTPSWASEMQTLTIALGRPMTRQEYVLWSEYLRPHINFIGLGSCGLLGYIACVPFIKKTNFPFVSKGPRNAYFFPSVHRPFIQGLPARALWAAARGAYICTGIVVSVAIGGAVMRSQNFQRASNDKRLDAYYRDRQNYNISILKDLGFDVSPQRRSNISQSTSDQPTGNQPTGKVSIQIQGSSSEPAQQIAATSLQDALALRKAFAEEIDRRQREGTWHRLGRQEYERAGGEPTGQDGSEPDGWQQQDRRQQDNWQQDNWQQEQSREQSREQAQAHEAAREQAQPWQYSDRQQDRRPQQQQSQQGAWDAIRANARAGSAQQQQRPSAPGNSTQDTGAGQWGASDGIDDLDDASPVAPEARRGEGTTTVPSQTWDQIRQQNRERTLKRLRERQQGRDGADAGGTQGQEGQGGSAWDSIRNADRRSTEQEHAQQEGEDHTFSEDQRRRETAKQQAQDEFDQMLERERRASEGGDPRQKR